MSRYTRDEAISAIEQVWGRSESTADLPDILSALSGDVLDAPPGFRRIVSTIGPDQEVLTIGTDSQRILVLPGDGSVIALDDGSVTVGEGYGLTQVQRAVLATRLRTWATLIEEADQ